jgi:hypothetical protein
MQTIAMRPAIECSGTISLPINYYFDTETAAFLGDSAGKVVREAFWQIARPPETFRSLFRYFAVPLDGTPAARAAIVSVDKNLLLGGHDYGQHPRPKRKRDKGGALYT